MGGVYPEEHAVSLLFGGQVGMVGLPLWIFACVVRLVAGISLAWRDLLAKARRRAMVQGYVVHLAQVVAFHEVLGETLPVGRPYLIQLGLNDHVLGMVVLDIWLEAFEPGCERLRFAV